MIAIFVTRSHNYVLASRWLGVCAKWLSASLTGALYPVKSHLAMVVTSVHTIEKQHMKMNRLGVEPKRWIHVTAPICIGTWLTCIESVRYTMPGGLPVKVPAYLHSNFYGKPGLAEIFIRTSI